MTRKKVKWRAKRFQRVDAWRLGGTMKVVIGEMSWRRMKANNLYCLRVQTRGWSREKVLEKCGQE